MNKLTVAVTGGSGFVAAEIIGQLLESGYAVRSTVRNKEKAGDLQSVFPSLQLFEADLMKPGSFDDCFNGVDYVIHAASPFQLSVANPQTDLVEPALEGTKNVLSSVEKYLGTIKRVVVTSSVAAILQEVPEEGKVFSESDWNTTSSLTAGPYRYSKVLAEKAAWDWWKGKEEKIKLLVINPAFVLGAPRINRSDSTSIKCLVDFFNGSQLENGVPNLCIGAVDIRNVAQAHIRALEKENISGRFLVSSSGSYSRLEFIEILKKTFPQYTLPNKMIGELKPRLNFNNEKATKELDIKFIPIDETLIWAVQGLIELGLIEKK